MSTSNKVREDQIAQEIIRDFQRTLRAMPDLLFELDADGRYHQVWTQHPELLVAEESRLLGRTVTEVLPPEAATECMAALQDAAKEGSSHGRKMLIPLPQGDFWFELSVAPKPRLQADSLQHFIVLSRDVTNRINIATDLQRSEERLKEAQALAHIGSWELDLVANKLIWSDEIFRIFEIDPKEFTATYEGFLSAIHPEDRILVNSSYQEAVANKTPYSIEHRLLLPSGRIKWVWEKGATKYDASGKAIVSIGTVQDITQRKNSEEVLLATEQRLSFHLKNTPVAAIEWDLDFKVKSWNPAAEAIFGYSCDEAIGKHATFIIPKSSRKLVDDIWEKLATGTGGQRSINENSHKNGNLLYCEWFNTPLLNHDGEIIGVASLANDITVIKQTDEALQNSLTKVRALSERIISIQEEERRMISHELHDEVGQNLTAVKIHLQTMEWGCRDCSRQVKTENLLQALSAVSITLEQVRDLSLNLRPFQLDDLGLSTSLRTMLDRNAFASKWETHFDENLGQNRIDPKIEIACYRIAQEALTNIMRHAHASEVWVKLLSDETMLVLTIQDDGVGFDASLSEDRRTGNLGLLGMRERARSVMGEIGISSNPDAGTRIEAHIPLILPARRSTDE